MKITCRPRFEVKFIVSAALKTAILHDVLAMTTVDPHAIEADCKYHVKSLYYDSPLYCAYREKIDGILQRRKFRIRTYEESPEVRFLEIKERFSNRIHKRKRFLKPEQYQAVLNRQRLSDLSDCNVYNEFSYYCATTNIKPLLLIEYSREPHLGITDKTLRITFDSDIIVRKSKSLECTSTPYKVLPNGYSILEIKFNNYMPHWVHSLVRKFSLRDTAYSKYCLGLEELIRRGRVNLA